MSNSKSNHGESCEHDEHDHSTHHTHAPSVSSANEKVVLAGLLLTFSFMVAEVVGGIVSGSLALIADAGHMLTDAAALALTWAGFRIGRRASDSRRTFGYLRFEVLAGFINAMTLFFLVAWIVWEAIERLMNPGPILSGPMFVIALIGLSVNICVFLILRKGDKENINIRGATIHVLGDMLGSVAAILAAAFIHITGWTPIDPILSVLISMLIMRSAWMLLRSSAHILMEGSPANVDPSEIRSHLQTHVTGIASADHIHVWSITSGHALATLEVVLVEGAIPQTCSMAVKKELREHFGILHTTVEIVWPDNMIACSLTNSSNDSVVH